MLNSFSGIGRLGSDPEVTKHNGSITARFDLAINEFYRQDDELQKATHWLPCKAHGRLAEICGEFLQRGSQVAVRGPIKTELLEDDHDSQRRRLVVSIIIRGPRGACGLASIHSRRACRVSACSAVVVVAVADVPAHIKNSAGR